MQKLRTSQEAIVSMNMAKRTGSRLAKEWHKAPYSPFTYSVYMLNMFWGKLDGKKMNTILKKEGRRNINNLHSANDITPIAENANNL